MISGPRWIVWSLALSVVLAAQAARGDGATDPPDKGGTRPEAISLPSGPGSIQGLGEETSSQPALGAALASVPIAVPPGPSGLQPDLTLRYDSRQGSGLVGVGWSQLIPNVARRTDHGLPHYDDGDELLWNGALLVRVDTRTYRLQVEGEFTRIVALDQGFRADRKDGSKLFLGTDATARVESQGRVFRWYVSRWVDVHGDQMTFDYEKEGGQVYLVRITYGRPGGSLDAVALSYETRPDPIVDARPGFLVTTNRRLAGVATSAGTPVRQMRLGYAPGLGLSRLASLESCGSDGVTCLPTLRFTSTTFDPATAALAALHPPGAWLGDPDVALTDLDGDSLPDVVRMRQEGASFWRNTGAPGFGLEQPLAGAPGVALSTTAAVFQDLDGDGRADLLLKLGLGAQGLAFLPAAGGGLGVPVELWARQDPPPPPPLQNPDVQWLDLDGDGRADVLRGDHLAWTAWFNLGGGQFSAPRSVDAPIPEFALDGPEIRLADMNDDGLVDLVAVHSRDIQVLLNLGFGHFGPPVSMQDCPDVGGDDARLALGDADGDGLPDLTYVAPGRLSIWLNQANGGFGPEIRIPGAPSYDPLTTAVRFSDVNGNGTRDIIYSGSADGAPFFWVLDLTAGARPNLLEALDNGFGGIRSFRYRTTGDFMASAAAAGDPWSTFCPFPLQVVAGLESFAGRSPREIEIRNYRDPFYDGSEHLFRGFAGVTRGWLGDAHAEGKQAILTFHTGRDEPVALAGQLAVERLETSEGVLLERKSRQVAAIRAALGIDGKDSVFPAPNLETREVFEGASIPARTELAEAWDDHGNLIRREERGRVDLGHRDPAAGTWVYRFAEDEERWLLGRLAEQELVDGSGARISLERRYYDGDPFVGLPLGEVLLGDLVRTAAWVAGDRFIDVARSSLDRFGNPLAKLDADGRRTELGYDRARAQWVTEERRIPGPDVVLRFQAAYDPGSGQILRFVDADGSRTRLGLDPLGRIISIERPGDPEGDPGERRDYHFPAVGSDEPVALIRRRRAAPGEPFAIEGAQLYDGLLRPRASVESAENGLYAVRDWVERDARGNQALKWQPFFSKDLLPREPDPSVGSTETFSDALGRVRRELPAGGGESGYRYGADWVEASDTEASAGRARPLLRSLDFRGRTIASSFGAAGPAIDPYRFGYDPAGHPTLRVSPSGALTTAAYDGLGRLVADLDPDSGENVWTFDGAGHLRTRTDGRGATVVWNYDGAGRVLEEADQEGSRATYQYDASEVPGCEPAPGRLVSVQDRSGWSCFAYDEARRLKELRILFGGRTAVTSFGYDALDRLIQLGYPDGTALRYEYGGRGAVVAVPGLLISASYDPAGAAIERIFANGLDVALGRDRGGRVTSVTGKVNRARLLEVAYRLRPSGAPYEETDDLGITRFTLDDQERLRVEERPNGRRSQEYDQEGRLRSRWADPPDARLPGMSPSFGQGAGPHALTSDQAGAYGYDGMGHRVSGRGIALDLDALGQTLAARGPDFTAEYLSAFDGERRKRRVQWDDGRRLEVVSLGPAAELVDGVLWKHVLIGTERIASLTGVFPTTATLGGCQTTSENEWTPILGLLLVLGGLARGRKLARAKARGRVRT